MRRNQSKCSLLYGAVFRVANRFLDQFLAEGERGSSRSMTRALRAMSKNPTKLCGLEKDEGAKAVERDLCTLWASGIAIPIGARLVCLGCPESHQAANIRTVAGHHFTIL